MTKIEELEQKLNEASSGFEFVINEIRKELVCYKTQKELKESKKEDKWEPALNKLYWYRGDEGINLFDTWENDEIDEWRRKNLKIFETEEQCEKYWKFMDTVKEKSYEFSKEEWGNHNLAKYFIAYDWGNKNFIIINAYLEIYLGKIYFARRSDAQYIIDNYKEELMKYWI